MTRTIDNCFPPGMMGLPTADVDYEHFGGRGRERRQQRRNRRQSKRELRLLNKSGKVNKILLENEAFNQQINANRQDSTLHQQITHQVLATPDVQGASPANANTTTNKNLFLLALVGAVLTVGAVMVFRRSRAAPVAS